MAPFRRSLFKLFKKTKAFANAKIGRQTDEFLDVLRTRHGVRDPQAIPGPVDYDYLARRIDEAGHIHFDLTGFSRGKQSLINALKRGKQRDGFTNFELYHVLTKRMDSATFYRNGDVIDPKEFFGTILEGLDAL